MPNSTFEIVSSQDDKYDFVIKIASGKSDFDAVCKWLEAHLKKKQQALTHGQQACGFLTLDFTPFSPSFTDNIPGLTDLSFSRAQKARNLVS